MDDFVTEFNEKMAAKSREVCERIEREDAARRGGLSEVERMILDAWPRFEDGSPAWFGDGYLDADGGLDSVYGVQLSVGEDRVAAAVISKDGWHTCLGEGARLERPWTAPLDFHGKPVSDGDEVRYGGRFWRVRYAGRSRWMPGRIQIETDGLMTYVDPGECEVMPDDTWELIAADASKGPCEYFGVDVDRDDGCNRCPHYHGDRDCQVDMNADVVRRARRMAGDED